MLSDNGQKIFIAVIATLPTEFLPKEEEIQGLAQNFRNVFPVSEEEFSEVIKKLHSTLEITMDVGVVLIEEDFQSWFPARKPEIDPFYWSRFSMYLKRNEGWAPRVVSTLDIVTDEILDLLGNPERQGQWRRRGLVLGDVQSGKTATYTALCCKAADAGYKLIILMTGTLENLRRQTQERMDLGFVGLDSSGMLSLQQSRRDIGVGLIDRRKTVGVFTSRTTDFRGDLLNRLGFKLSSFRDPVLVVIKKNRRILENLTTWLRAFNADENGRINAPMLLIDDEADNASINTNPAGRDPTAINERIRSLLQLFVRSSYVGFTATPFANIFIDPDTEAEMLGNDLFPRDFIYALDVPNNYIGADAIFSDEPSLPNCLRDNSDAVLSFPPSHQAHFIVNGIPPSLTYAIYCFILTSAIRDLRGEGHTHRSMLVNVSRFTNVQGQVADIISRELLQIQQDIRHYSQLPEEEAFLNDNIRSLKQVWEREFDDGVFSWNTIQRALPNAALPILVRQVNQRTGAASLDYEPFRETGLRVIAVGGNSLSRGLTLRGLSDSYFFRNSQMYDTLMQMGRWFGYRDGYEDLCRIWMTEEAIHWYAHISSAINELRDEIKRMKLLNLTPRDFGLKVRAHPDSLIVTARNKMRTARTVERLISVSKQGIETPRLHSDPDIIRANALAAERFLRGLRETGIDYHVSPWGNTLWTNVPKERIINLLREYNSHPLNFSFHSNSLALFLHRTGVEKLELWDVVIPNGSENEESFAEIRFRPQKRTVEMRRRERFILVSGSKARVGSRGIEKEGIPVEVVREKEEEYRRLGRSIPDKEYRAVREKPLLLLHLIKAVGDGIPDMQGTPLVALGLSFPEFNDPDQTDRVRYNVNVVEWRNLFENEVDDDSEDDDDTI